MALMVTAAVTACASRGAPPAAVDPSKTSPAVPEPAPAQAAAATPPGPPPVPKPTALPEPPPAPDPDVRTTSPAQPIALLRRTIDELLSDPALARSTWAIDIRSLDTNDTLYASNARKLMMPASNMKVVTIAAAAERLGWDYRFETTLLRSGPIVNGTLQGDLVVRGTGDPTITRRSSAQTFEAWAELLAGHGIRRIDGRIIGDDSAFDDEGIGAGWAWDYLAEGYAAPVGALAYDNDATMLAVKPGPRAGAPVVAAIESNAAGLTLINAASTAPDDEPETLTLRRVPGSPDLRLEGRMPVRSTERLLTVSVDNPTEYFVRTLHSVLVEKGIVVTGAAIDMDRLPAPPDPAALQPVAVHHSPPLADIATVVMKISQNMYADTLLKATGRAAGTATAEGGRKAVAEVLSGWGIEPESYVMYDGSGLSRYNYVTADMLVRILRRMHEDPKHAAPFLATLPVGARDGSLARRYVDRPAAGRVWAKTGSIANVRSLSGYVETAGGEMLVFAILANHFTVKPGDIDAVTDAIVDALASFRRE
jgi:D-alanyl-D-alanine carboxypeptidase/D-alanyl-D-alanine-endopeptidase (penicillin-binding protein 4)